MTSEARRGLRSTAVVAWIGAVLVGALPSADAASCEDYAIEGLLPGMSLRDVRKRMGEKGDLRVTATPRGFESALVYARTQATVYALFDEDVSRSSRAKVVSVRRCLRTDAEAPETFAALELDRLGEPTTGIEHLEAALADGAAVWREEECDLVLTAFRRQGEWWTPESRALCTEVRALGPKRQILARAPRRAATREEPAARAPGRERAVPPPTPTPPSPSPTKSQAPAAAADGAVPTRATAATPPELVRSSYVAPRYPDLPPRSRWNARVLVEVAIGADGTVGEVKVLGASRPGIGFEEAAVEAVKQWRFKPATRDGHPIESSIVRAVEFRPDKKK